MTTDADQPFSDPRVRVVSRWDEQALETEGITPADASSAVILWEGFPDVEGGVPERLARPLATALTMLGEVFFRTRDRPLVNARVLGTVKASRMPFAQSWDIVGTRDVTTAMTLFESGWAQGDQIAIVAPAHDDRATAMLATEHIGKVALEGEELVFAAIVDGVGMLVAAPDRTKREDAIALILQQCAEGGIPQAPE